MILGPLALAGFGGLIVAVARHNERKQRRLIDESREVSGTILGSRVGQGYSGQGNSSKMAHVTFEYEIDGQTYQSTHIRPGGTNFGSFTGRTARRRAARYDPGDSVTVHVPASDHRLGFLEPTTSTRASLIMQLIGGGIAVFALLVSLILLLF